MSDDVTAPAFGSPDLRLPDELRGPLLRHLDDLRARYRGLDWAADTGFGERPAVVVIDLTPWWTDPSCFPMGSDVDTVVHATREVRDAARRAGLPIFFTTLDHDPADPPSPHDRKLRMRIEPGDVRHLAVDERLGPDGARRRHLSAEIPKDGVPRDLGTRARVGLNPSERRLAAVEGRRDAHERGALHGLGFDEGVVEV